MISQFFPIPARRTVALLCLSAVLGACGGRGEPIEVRKAWSPAAPPGSSVAAVYVELVARDADTLLGAFTPVAGQVDMHETLEENGMMKMRPLEQVELPAGRSVALEPGGMHMMLMDVRQALPAGAHFPLTLRFARAGEVETIVTVHPPGTMP